MEADISSWEKEDYFTTGKRVKQWFKDSSGNSWLFKEPEVEGERIAEFVAYKVGKELFNLEIPETLFADYGGKKGVIIKSFLVNEVNGKKLILFSKKL